jgi:hypothetical protein
VAAEAAEGGFDVITEHNGDSIEDSRN